jgi:hypothetical protein
MEPWLHTLVFNSSYEQVAVIDHAGIIVDVNAAWIGFGIDNGLSADYVWAWQRLPAGPQRCTLPRR